MRTMSRQRVQAAIQALEAGSPLILVGTAADGPGTLVMPADVADTASVAFFVRYTSGFLCVAMTTTDCERLELPPMCYPNSAPDGVDYRVTVDAAEGIGTGISARDRARTIRTLADPRSTSRHLVRPGHVVPVCVGEDLQDNPSLPDASVSLMSLAGHRPVALLAEITGTDNAGINSASGVELARFAAQHELPLLSIADLMEFNTNQPLRRCVRRPEALHLAINVTKRARV
jgi:3,4-dihydroxy 2-butanone 4-phosphate synthase/GTP cyclohydrolase II